MRILSTAPPTAIADVRTGRPSPTLTRRRHVDLMRMCSAACRGSTR
ncbi:hypothetical protein EV382_0569 [Micromonospora violae]|uniref:Uncharacterized protein n=1 Tax=Micromonospora violae TaxID=1278207 RepID=A0A4V2FNK9_9ACTN|nr:hypothetical protein EV382_0569 [Micromonospora violae]